MRVREFERLLAAQTSNWSASEIDQRTRALRAAGKLPVGGHGLNAPDVQAEQAAMILIALAATERASASVEAVDNYASLRWQRLQKGETAFAGKRTFGEALIAILEDRDNERAVAEVQICRTWPWAIVRHGPAADQLAQYRSPWPAQGSGDVEEIVRLNYHFLQPLAIELAGTNDPGSDRTNVKGER